MPGSGHGPARPTRWGWHQLRPDWARRLVDSADLRSGELVYDLGAGDGAITAELLRTGARVVALERHPGRVRTLRSRFGRAVADGQLRVLPIDLRSLRPPRHGFRVVANPPFDQTGALLRLLTTAPSGLRCADLVLQRDVVRRWSTQAEDDGAGRSRLPARFDGRRSMNLPAAAFHPPPSIATAVLRIRQRRA